jgi:hypothetical protein
MNAFKRMIWGVCFIALSLASTGLDALLKIELKIDGFPNPGEAIQTMSSINQGRL